MPKVAESSSSSTIVEQIKLRKPRNQTHEQPITAEADLTLQIPFIIQSTRCKSTISSLLLSNEATPTPTPTSTDTTTKKKTNNFAQSTFRGLGCTAAASQQVSVPAVIRTSADWEAKKVKKKKHQHQKKKSDSGNSHNCNSTMKIGSENMGIDESFFVIQDVWCGPGIGFSTDAVLVGRLIVLCLLQGGMSQGEARLMEKRLIIITERRATVNPETLSFLDSDSAFVFTRPEPDLFGSRYYRHVPHPSPDGLAEIMMLQNSLLMGGRFNSHDLFCDWRLDVDNMTYEQLLELGDRIGYVSTGLKEDEMSYCLWKIKHSIINDLPLHLSTHVDQKCSICQEEYEADEEMGKLNCGHSFHIKCIKQWLSQKNACPVCKAAAVGRP